MGMTRLLLLCILSWGLCALAGCNDDETDAVTPEKGQVVLDVRWPQGAEAPAQYTVRIGENQATMRDGETRFPHSLDAGDYGVSIYNSAPGVKLNGMTATVESVDGYLTGLPEWIYAYVGEVTVLDDAASTVTAAMVPQIRQLNMTLRFPDGNPGLVSAVEAQLSGVASGVDMATGAISGQGNVKPLFLRSGDVFAGSVRLVGTAGTQALTLSVTLPGGTYRLPAVDVSQALATFNDNRMNSLDVELSVSRLGLDGLTVGVTGWKEGNTIGWITNPDIHPAQVTFDWTDVGAAIQAAEITDSRGRLYASTVREGKTTELQSIPSDIYSVVVHIGGIPEDVSMKYETYNSTTGVLTFTESIMYVRTVNDLSHIKNNLAANYLQVNDLTLSGAWLPIGQDFKSGAGTPFSGTYDGDGKSISGLTVSDLSDAGLFAINAGIIKNLNIASGTISAPGKEYAGAVCARNEGTIDNCTNAASVSAGTHTGGITGYNAGTITAALNRGDITGGMNTGGIAGCNSSGGSISNSVNTASVAGVGGQNVGGICGHNDTGAVAGCTNEGEITNKDPYTGGIVGLGSGGGITYCLNKGDVKAGSSAGGITGYMFNYDTEVKGQVAFCTNEAAIEGGSYIGGVAGGTYFPIIGCENKGVVTCSGYGGGIAGTNNYAGALTGCANRADVAAPSGMWVGGVIGNNSAPVKACYNTGKVQGSGRVGGVAGDQYGSLTACYNTADVDHHPDYIYGGVAGMGDAASFKACYWTGSAVLGTWSGSDQAIRFYEISDPASGWPEEDVESGWGLASGVNTYEQGYYWASLGDKGVPAYPTLWWENSGELRGAARDGHQQPEKNN